MKQTIYLLTACILFSCGHHETKKIVSTFPNGNPEVVHFYSDPDDTLTYRKEVFYESGKLDYKGDFMNGNQEGVWTWWYENGKKKDQCKFSEGLYYDTIFHWYENGQLKQLELVTGKRAQLGDCCNCNGTVYRYYENGKPQEIVFSSENKRQGIRTEYWKNGGWRIETYKNDTLNGETTEHFLDSTQMIVIGQYKDGKEDGLWKWFNKDSVLEITNIYSEGKFMGDQIHYYPNGQIRKKGFVIDNQYKDEVSYFDEKGRLTKIEYYKDGELIKSKNY